ncbi:MAG: FeoB-associated Cys-rich membrane protein [Oscillospiraceae bacterium]|nr:FeoB-associated Cys-rich membrane protein [Oscillospiraceae bacterium]
MFRFFADNWGTITAGMAVTGLVAVAVAKMVRDKRKGKTACCECGCEGCAKASACHTK